MISDPTKSITSNQAFRESSPRINLRESQSSVTYHSIKASAGQEGSSNIFGIQKSKIYQRNSLEDDEVKYDVHDGVIRDTKTPKYEKRGTNSHNISRYSIKVVGDSPNKDVDNKKRYRRNRNMRHNKKTLSNYNAHAQKK